MLRELIVSSLFLPLAAAVVANLPASAQADRKICHVSCTDPHAACGESEQVIDVLQKMTRLLSLGEFEQLSAFLDENVTTFDENSRKLIVGKAEVLANLKREWENGPDKLPTVAYTIDRPYAQVNGNVATVNFVAHKVIGGLKPTNYESHSTVVFRKEDGSWKKLYYRGAWRKVLN
jgi:hypothetical protein